MITQCYGVYTPLSLLKKKLKKKITAHGVVSVPDVNKLNQQPIGQISLLAGVDLDAKVSCQKAFILLESPVTCSTTTDCGTAATSSGATESFFGVWFIQFAYRM